MKRILFTIALSLLFSFHLSAQNKESIFKGDLQYNLYYTDTTKLELEHFLVLYKPRYYKRVSRKSKHYIYPYINRGEYTKFRDKVVALAIKHFGEKKFFNKDGVPIIDKISFAVRCLTEEVFLRYICFSKDAYNLVTDEEILSFAKEFNETLRISISNKDECNKRSMVSFCAPHLYKY
ncbi:MAG: hypothetical protein IKK64_03525 [Bacteroidales bacterium]|nr:hypothetical protein [Bacteroidales bacterium]